MRTFRSFGLLVAVFAVTAFPTTTGHAEGCGEPCYSEVNDILGGQRELLPDDDLYLAIRYDDAVLDYSLETSALAISSDTSKSHNINCAAESIALVQGLVGRVFALANDVVVEFRLSSDCSQLNLHVSDPQNSGNDSSLSNIAGDPKFLAYVGMGLGDFNLDGYQDLVYVQDFTARVYTAVCNYDPFSDCKAQGGTPADGLVQGPDNTLKTDGPYGATPVTGDFNGDGVLDAAWPAYDDGGEVYVELVSICPAAGVSVNGVSCAQWGQMIPLSSIDMGIKVIVTKSGGPRPVVALNADNFDGSVDSTTGIATDELLVAISDSNNTHATLSTYRYDPETGHMNNLSSLVWPEKLKPDDAGNIQLFLGSAFLDESSADVQAVFASTKDSNSKNHRGFVGVITFDQQLAMTEVFEVTPNNDKTRIFGMAVGRFDPPDKPNGDTDFGQQIAVLVDHNNDNTLLQIYSAKLANSYQPDMESQYEITSDRLFNDTALALAGLQAGDLQGRSLLLGAPEKITMVQQTQPAVVVGLPPMHVDFIEPLGGGTPAVMNLSVFPSTFNTAFDFDVTNGNEASHQGTTSYAAAYKETIGLKVRYGPPVGDSVTYKFKLAINETHQKSVTKTWDVYENKTYRMTAQTTFDDLVSGIQKQVNVFSYPVIGQYVCPADSASSCPSDCSTGESPCAPLMVQYSGVDNLVFIEQSDGGAHEWYQPVTEPGNLFSYPGSLDLLELDEPLITGPDTQDDSQTVLDLLSSANTVVWDSQTAEQVNIDWDVGASGSKSVSVANAVSFDAGISVKLKGSGVGTSATAKFGFDTNQSFSTSSLNTSIQSLDSSLGVVLSRGLGPDGTSTDIQFKYEGQSFIYALVEPINSFQKDFQSGLLSGDIQSQGPIKVVHATDMLSANSGDWWKQAYSYYPDIALNHPQRWLQRLQTSQNTQQVMFNCPVGYTSDFGTPSGDPGSCVVAMDGNQPVQPNPLNVADADFYTMKGLFITPGTENGPTVTTATLGDTITLQARVYNYSLTNMPPGTVVHVQFYAQPWDSTHGVFSSGNAEYGFAEAVYIGEAAFMDPIPGFCGGSQGSIDPCTDSTVPNNWTLAQVEWDTSTLSPYPVNNTDWKFWVVAWMEDGNGDLVDETPGHGLSGIPASGLGSLAEVPVETYSNNLGVYNQVFSLLLPEETGDAESAPEPESRRIRVAGIEYPHGTSEQHKALRLRAHLKTEGARYDQVTALLFEGHPDRNGRLVDLDILPGIDADRIFVVPFRYVPKRCGARKLYVQVFQHDGKPPLLEPFLFKVRCATGRRLGKYSARRSGRDLQPPGSERRGEFRRSTRRIGSGQAGFREEHRRPEPAN